MIDQKAQGAFFGRRQGRPLRGQQQASMDSLLPKLEIDLTKAPPMPLTELFASPIENIWLEIGFGGGEHLLHHLQQQPKTGFIGVEPFINGMAKLLSNLAAFSQLQERIRLYNNDAVALLDWLPDSCLAGIDLFYPDPWPKKKHWKRRFVNQQNLTRFARVLKPGGIFRFASDIDGYVNWALQHCMEHEAFSWQAQDSRDWTTPFAGWPGTRYEKKALKEQRQPTYLTFRRL